MKFHTWSKSGFLQPGDLIPQGIQFSESFVLQFVAQPRRDVTFLVRPRHHVRTMEYGDGLVFSQRLRSP